MEHDIEYVDDRRSVITGVGCLSHWFFGRIRLVFGECAELKKVIVQ